MTFEELVAKFGEEHSRLLALQKIDKADSAEIKAKFAEAGTTEQIGGEYVAKLSETKTENFDEELLIGILMDEGPEYCSGIIKTKQYVDMDALEDAIYNGRIDPTKLVPAKTVGITQKLTVKKVK